MEATSAFDPGTPKRNPLSLGIWMALVCYGAIVIPRFDYIPIWDSLENLEEYLFRPRSGLTFDDLLLMHNGHPSLGYFWPFWVGQWLFPSEMLVVHILNLLIGALAIIAFGKIASIAFQGMAGKLEVSLITIAFAVHPIVTAYALNMSPDYGILAYFLATLWLLYSGRLGWAAVTGVFLIFSKEIGVPSYLLLLAFYLSGAIRKVRWVTLRPLLIPIYVFGLFCTYQLSNGRHIFPWSGQYMSNQTIWDIYLPNPFKTEFKMACLGPFIFEFQWLFTLVIIFGLFHSIVCKRPKGNNAPGVMSWFWSINLPFRCFIFLLIGCLYIDSRVLLFTNQRYLFTLYPLLLLAFFAALIQLGVKKQFRAILLMGGIILFIGCNFRTLDPISRKIAGTFPFGRHSLLSVATIRPECGGYARDQAVYNLEHTYLSYLLDMAFAKIQPTDQTTIVIPSDSWWVMSRLDPKTWHRTESTKPPFIKPLLKYPLDVANNPSKPETIFVVHLPYLHNQGEMTLLESFYELKERHLFTKSGYELEVFQMTLKTPLSTALNRCQNAVGLGTWYTQVSFTNILVTDAGNILYQSDFINSGTNGWLVYSGNWNVNRGVYQETSLYVNCHSIFAGGGTNWNSYTISLKARKDGGDEGFLIIFNWLDDNNCMWWNIGGWNNTQYAIERKVNGVKSIVGSAVPGSVIADRWYDVRIVSTGDHIQCYLDNQLIHDINAAK